MATPTEPCEHRTDWVPEALIFGGPKKVAEADVVCFFEGCGWSGRVPFSAISADPDTEATP